MSYDATESLQIALREYLAEIGSSSECRACQLATELARELGRDHHAGTAAGVLGCCHCDNPEGAHP